MRKDKNKTAKPKPRRGEVWQYTPGDSSKPTETWEIQAIEGSGKNATLDVLVRWDDDQDQPHSETRVIPLTKFADPHVELVNESKAEDDAPAPKPVVIVKPIKNGLSFTCPGQSCGDKHDFIVEASAVETFRDEFDKAYAKFVQRHAPHMLDGTLFAGHNE